ncbi:unnamed protein product [Trifolium pratense]|uniref:Uncharacterized protein n=1 Tax=Trifolium pratense TaxID=57577 RepID=A0ACB0KJ85_TRIPR|nr:unnamed protein product [Trifolium pratense]
MWWREIVKIRDDLGEIWGEWFGECVSKKVGDGSDNFFWTDPWLVRFFWYETETNCATLSSLSLSLSLNIVGFSHTL